MKFPQKMLAVTLVASVLFLCVYSGFGLDRGVMASTVDDDEICVVIDPGHGGEDGGCVGISGASEAAINLDISLRLRDLLSLCGVKTSMIRETDVAVYSEGCGSISEKKVSDLKNRVKTVNETQNAVLVSIHQNFFEQSKYSGAQVFYGKAAGSRELAEQMQQALRNAVDPSNRRQAKSIGSVYLMEHAACPAVLVECGFLSNPGEAGRLQQPEYQQKLASAITSTLTFFIQERENDHEVENCIYLQSVRKRDAPLAGAVPVLRGVEQYC